MGNFQNIFKELRTSKEMTQSETAEKLGISRSTIGMYETGAREPDFETLEKIADFFHVNVDYLLGRTGQAAAFSEADKQYYINDDARDMAQFLFENPEYKVLFDASRKVKKEDIDFVKQMIDRVRGNFDDAGC